MLQAIRNIIFRKPFAKRQDLTGKTFIVTGAAINSIGYTTAEQLADWGATVIVTRRSGSDKIIDSLAERLGERSKLYSHDVDIADSVSVKTFAEWFEQNFTSLDVLINCAGIHLDLMSKWTEPKLSDDGYEMQWRTNYLGTTHLTHSLLPILLKTADKHSEARVVNVVSMLHDKGLNADFFENTRPYNSWHAYGQSKLGLVHFTNELDKRYGAQGLKAYSLHPGEVFTNVAGKGLEGNPLVEAVRNFFAPVERFFLMTPLEGAQTQLMCSTDPSAQSGKYYRNCKVSIPSDQVGDNQVSSRLWDENLQWISTL